MNSSLVPLQKAEQKVQRERDRERARQREREWALLDDHEDTANAPGQSKWSHSPLVSPRLLFRSLRYVHEEASSYTEHTANC